MTVGDTCIRPAIAFVIFASGLKHAGMGTTALGWTLCAVLLACGVYWLVWARPRADGGKTVPVRETEPDILRR